MAIADGGMVGPVMEGSGGGWRCMVRHQSVDPCQEKKIGPVAYVITVCRVTCLANSQKLHPEY